MAANTVETWFFNGQEYLTPNEVARYLGIEHKALLAEITKGQLPVTQVESRRLIELEDLKAFTMPPPARRGR